MGISCKPIDCNKKRRREEEESPGITAKESPVEEAGQIVVLHGGGGRGNLRPVVHHPGHIFKVSPLLEAIHTCLFGHECLARARSLHITSFIGVSRGTWAPKRGKLPQRHSSLGKRLRNLPGKVSAVHPPRKPDVLSGGGALQLPGQIGGMHGRDWCNPSPRASSGFRWGWGWSGERLILC